MSAVREIRARYAAGETQAVLARAFDLSQPYISDIVGNRVRKET